MNPKFKDIPDMWASPLYMEMSLHTPNYPIRLQMIEQWHGMLAVIALAEVRRFKMRAEFVELGKLAGGIFAKSLMALLPNPDNVLYKRKSDDRKSLNSDNPWQDIYVFLWNDQPVGMTSPSTLVCPSEEGNWDGLPWWDGDRLVSPTRCLNLVEKIQLALWLENLQDVMSQQVTPETNRAIGNISMLLDSFKIDLLRAS